ncbi:MAG: lecithin retinol acyltransferase family protein [Pirellulales bacterium]
MAKGDHIYVNLSFRGLPYQHHGIDMGDGTVIHLAPESGPRLTATQDARFQVRRDSIEEFSTGKRVRTMRHQRSLQVDEIVAAAESMVGKAGYNLLDNNCEHFASQCATGKSDSRQVEFGHSTAVAIASAATKSVWAVGNKLATKFAIESLATKLVLKPHPLTLLADGVEAAATAGGCAVGLSAEWTRRIARTGGEVTALAVGCAVGGPAGGAASLAIHRSSTIIGERVCRVTRAVLLKLSRRQTDSKLIVDGMAQPSSATARLTQ